MRILTLLVFTSCAVLGGAPLPASAQEEQPDGEKSKWDSDKAYEEISKFTRMGRYREALEVMLKEHEATVREMGPAHRAVATSFFNLAYLYKVLYRQAERRRALENSVRILERIDPPEPLRLARSLHHLGQALIDGGAYARAETILKRVQALIQDRPLGKFNYLPDGIAYSFGALYHARGDHARAERVHLDLLERLQGSADDPVAAERRVRTLLELMKVYHSLNERERLDRTLAQAAAECAAAPKCSDTYRTTILMQQARRARARGQLRTAYDHASQALTIMWKKDSDARPNLPYGLQLFGKIKMAMGDVEGAYFTHNKALQWFRLNFGEEHPKYALQLAHMAPIYHGLGRHKRERDELRKAVDLLARSFGADNPSTATYRVELALLEWRQGRPQLALSHFRQAMDSTDRYLPILLHTGSDDQRQARVRKVDGYTHLLVSLYLDELSDSREARILAANTVLRRKGLLLEMAQRERGQAQTKRASAEARTAIARLASVESLLARHIVRGPEHDPDGYQRRTAELWREQQEMRVRVSEQADRDHVAETQRIDYQAIQKRLPAGAALIEFLVNRPYNLDRDRLVEPYYAAFIIKKSGPPMGVPLARVDEIDPLVTDFRSALIRRLSATDDRGHALYKQVMAPMAEHLAGVSRLVIAPDGALSLVPFAALRDGEGRYLIDRYQIDHVNSGRELLEFGQSQAESDKIVLFGNPDYSGASSAAAGSASASASTERGLRARAWTRGGFADLPGTAREVRAIRPLFTDAQMLTGAEASEGALRAVEGPAILHIAAHGFFMPDIPAGLNPAEWAADDDLFTPHMPEAVSLENALLRSGLALTGANQLDDGTHDGIVTALEIAALDLRGTQLVVLSACQSGVGEVAVGQGIYGLRRSFALAGAATQVTSLWNVNDQSAERLMRDFYRRLLAGEPRGQAMRAAQRALRDSGEEYAHPYHWAVFVVSGDPSPIRMPMLAKASTGKRPVQRGCACEAKPGGPTGAAWLFVLLFFVCRYFRGAVLRKPCWRIGGS